jgi:hypothetical protein
MTANGLADSLISMSADYWQAFLVIYDYEHDDCATVRVDDEEKLAKIAGLLECGCTPLGFVGVERHLHDGRMGLMIYRRLLDGFKEPTRSVVDWILLEVAKSYEKKVEKLAASLNLDPVSVPVDGTPN